MSKEVRSFRVKDKGGPLGGKEIQHELPTFDFQLFINAPNAEAFIKKAYYAAAKKIAREIAEQKNGSVEADLDSFEMIIARSLNFTKADIVNWLKARDWTRIAKYPNPNELQRSLENWLPTLALRTNYQKPQISLKVAEKLVAELADSPSPDPVADYLFVILTVERKSPDIDILEI